MLIVFDECPFPELLQKLMSLFVGMIAAQSRHHWKRWIVEQSPKLLKLSFRRGKKSEFQAEQNARQWSNHRPMLACNSMTQFGLRQLILPGKHLRIPTG